MKVDGATVEYEDGVLVIRIPFKKILDTKKIEVRTERIFLTQRERQTLKGIMELKRNKEIANDLNISERTVKYHVSELLRKFGVRGRIDLLTVKVEGERG